MILAAVSNIIHDFLVGDYISLTRKFWSPCVFAVGIILEHVCRTLFMQELRSLKQQYEWLPGLLKSNKKAKAKEELRAAAAPLKDRVSYLMCTVSLGIILGVTSQVAMDPRAFSLSTHANYHIQSYNIINATA